VKNLRVKKVYTFLISIVPIENINKSKSKGVKLEDFEFTKVGIGIKCRL